MMRNLPFRSDNTRAELGEKLLEKTSRVKLEVMKYEDDDETVVCVSYCIEGDIEFDRGNSREGVDFAKALFEDITRPDGGGELC